jgi:hypothetical protein
MNFKFSAFDKTIVFDKSSGFVKSLISPSSGSVFEAVTEPNKPIMKLRLKSKGPRMKSRHREQVLHIPLHEKPWKVKDNRVCVCFPGPEPEEIPKETGKPINTISIGGPEPDEPDEMLHIELDATQGDWCVKPNLAKGGLDISFGGPEEP